MDETTKLALVHGAARDMHDLTDDLRQHIATWRDFRHCGPEMKAAIQKDYTELQKCNAKLMARLIDLGVEV